MPPPFLGFYTIGNIDKVNLSLQNLNQTIDVATKSLE